MLIQEGWGTLPTWPRQGQVILVLISLQTECLYLYQVSRVWINYFSWRLFDWFSSEILKILFVFGFSMIWVFHRWLKNWKWWSNVKQWNIQCRWQYLVNYSQYVTAKVASSKPYPEKYGSVKLYFYVSSYGNGNVSRYSLNHLFFIYILKILPGLVMLLLKLEIRYLLLEDQDWDQMLWQILSRPLTRKCLLIYFRIYLCISNKIV